MPDLPLFCNHKELGYFCIINEKYYDKWHYNRVLTENKVELLDLLNNTYQQYHSGRGLHDKWDSLESFFYDKERCYMQLYHCLDLGYDHYKELLYDNLYRCQHTFVTFLLGLAIAKRYGLLNGINVINTMPDEYLWMLTSLVHDYGYIKSGIAQKENLEVLDAKYHLLSDICTFKQLESTRGYSCKYPQFLTYSYETIINYYNYRNSTLNPYLNKDHEANDHGIYGACKCYEEYSDFYIKKEYPYYCITINDDPDDIKRMGYDAVRYNERPEIVKLARTEPLLYKTACLITAQHNMFKSSETTEDSEYKRWGLYPLLSTEPIAIDNRNPLLFLLSIVDTIDCTKRFEKLLISGESRISIPIKKVLKNIRIQFDDDGIIVDYTPLFLAFNKYFSLLNSKRKRDVLQTEIYNQVEAVIRLKNWVKCETRPLEPFIVKILLLT